MWPSHGFEVIDEAREWVGEFMHWYNHEHRHIAIKFVTPAQRHRGDDQAILAERDAFYTLQKQQRPDRWRRGTRDWSYQNAVTLNPIQKCVAIPDLSCNYLDRHRDIAFMYYNYNSF